MSLPLRIPVFVRRGAAGFRSIAGFLLLSTLFMALPADAGEEMDAYLPQDTIFYASMEIDAIMRDYRELAVVRFLRDSEVEPLWRSLWESIKIKLLEDESTSMVVPFMSLLSRVPGFADRISLAVVDMNAMFIDVKIDRGKGGDPDAPREDGPDAARLQVRESGRNFILSIAVSDREAFKRFLGELLALMNLDGGAMEGGGAGEGRIETVRLSGREDAGPAVYWTLRGDRFYLAGHEAVLARLLEKAAKDDREGTLLLRQDYHELKQRLQQKGKGLFFAINARAVRRIAPPDASEKDEEGKPPGQLIWLGANSFIQDHLIVDAVDLVYQDRKGAFSILDGFSPGIECPVPVPPNAVFFTCLNLSPAFLLRNIEDLLEANDPWAAKEFRNQRDMLIDGTGMDLEELSEAFTGSAALYMYFPHFGYIPNVVAAVPVKAGFDLEARLEKAADSTDARRMGYSLEKARISRDLSGYYISTRDQAIFFQPAFCLSKDRLLMASSLQELKRAVRWMDRASVDGGNLLDEPVFRETCRAAGGSAKENLLGVVYVDLGQLMATLYNSFVPLAGMFFAKETSIPIDTSLLPPGEVIEKYFDAVVMVMEDRRTEGGRVLSLHSASSLGLTPFFLAGASASTFYMLAPVPPPKKEVIEIRSGDMIPPSGDSPFMGILFEGDDPPSPGIYITGIIEGTPAEEVGLLEGDVLLKIDDRDIAVLPDISNVLKERRPGEVIEIVFLRGKERLTAALILGRRGDFLDQ